MKKISLYVIIDYIFKFALLFMINIIWCLYFIKDVIFSLCVSIITSIILIILFNLLDKKKNKRSEKKLVETQHIEDIKNTFIYMPQNEIIDFFYKLASQKHKAVKTKKYVEIINGEKIILMPHFKMDSLTCDKLIEIYNNINKSNVKKIIILCNKYNNDINLCLSNFLCKTIILDNKQVYYELLKKYEFYPKVTIQNKPKVKNTFKQLLATMFNKKKTKNYLISAVFIIFASFFVLYKIYYLIIATILLIFCIVCQFEFKFKKQSPEEILS